MKRCCGLVFTMVFKWVVLFKWLGSKRHEPLFGCPVWSNTRGHLGLSSMRQSIKCRWWIDGGWRRSGKHKWMYYLWIWGEHTPERFGTGKCLYSLRKSMTGADLGGRRKVESMSGWSVTIALWESACKD